MREILFLEPVLKEMIWGGSRLTEYGYEIPSDHTGECWAISAHPNGDCVIKSGKYSGEKLSTLWEIHKELFGGASGDRFPLLIKIIDAKDDLSIQVHPDDTYAKEHENGSLGKTECWYILDCDENASIVIGHNARNSQEVAEMIHEERWSELIREVPVKKGDFFQINPGCVHAIKGGTLILETQQNSDITYRVYDYGRLQNNKPRQLHVEQSIAVITAPFVAGDQGERTSLKVSGGEVEHLIKCPYYEVERIVVDGRVTLTQSKPFANLSVINGEGTIDGTLIKKGDHFILPDQYGEYVLEGKMELIKSTL